MPFICLRRSDIQDAVLQITDLWPNASQRNQSIDPQPQGPRYVDGPKTSSVILSSTGATQRYLAQAQVGLAAYLIANVEAANLAALTPAQADTIAASLIATMRAGGTLNLAAIDAALSTTAGVAATATLTFGGAPVNGETVTINGKVYTFRAVINGASVNGDVLNDALAANAIANLVAAINLGAGSGVKYAAAMTLHPTVSAAPGLLPEILDATAKFLGAAGNLLTNATNVTLGVWAPVGFFGSGLDASLTGGASTGTVLDVLRILAGATYTVPAGTVIQVPVSTFNPQPTPAAWNSANFSDFKDVLVSDSSFYTSLAQGQISGFLSPQFSYRGVTSPALTVYDNAGAVL
jgi:hypothetical protein